VITLPWLCYNVWKKRIHRLLQFLPFFGKVIDQLNHFTCKPMEIHISI
jgi:hypothetical protein